MGEVTLPQVIKGAGCATSMVGEWHLRHQSPNELAMRRGLDEYIGISHRNDMRSVRLLDGEAGTLRTIATGRVSRCGTGALRRAMSFSISSMTRPNSTTTLDATSGCCGSIDEGD